jgi:pimeloyl-ACP methyl ester carboxylesterase
MPLRVGKLLKRTIPRARLVVLDSSHLPHTTHPSAVAAGLIPFADHPAHDDA